MPKSIRSLNSGRMKRKNQSLELREGCVADGLCASHHECRVTLRGDISLGSNSYAFNSNNIITSTQTEQSSHNINRYKGKHHLSLKKKKTKKSRKRKKGNTERCFPFELYQNNDYSAFGSL